MTLPRVANDHPVPGIVCTSRECVLCGQEILTPVGMEAPECADVEGCWARRYDRWLHEAERLNGLLNATPRWRWLRRWVLREHWLATVGMLERLERERPRRVA